MSRVCLLVFMPKQSGLFSCSSLFIWVLMREVCMQLGPLVTAPGWGEWGSLCRAPWVHLELSW